MTEQILKIENLELSFRGRAGIVQAVRGVSLEVNPGETLALVGESGCGKTAMCREILRLHAGNAVVERGRIILCGKDILGISEEEMLDVRGRDAAMVFQDPMSFLDPTFSVGRQIMKTIIMYGQSSLL